MSAVAVRERPILFSGPMVRAILEGRKTQTRRAVNRLSKIGPITQLDKSDTPGWDYVFRDKRMRWNDLTLSQMLERCPYGQTGDQLWVRESWQSAAAMNQCHQADDYYVYRATDPDWETMEGWRWRPSIHMPRVASRITLEITAVRVERLQGISDADSAAEGVKPDLATDHPKGCYYTAFRDLWRSINGPESWAANPWVWVVEFKKVITK